VAPYRRANVSEGKRIGGHRRRKTRDTTTHYVAKDLGDAPIIEHDVVRVEHHRHASMTWCLRVGAEVERLVLSRAAL
jgi:formyltetrahydrofolate hydrolase